MLEMIGGGLSQMLSIPSDGTTYLCGPVYHSAQWAFSFLPLLTGSRVLMRHRFDPEESLRLIDEHAVTNVHLVPTQFHRLLRADEARAGAFSGEVAADRLARRGALPAGGEAAHDRLVGAGDRRVLRLHRGLHRHHRQRRGVAGAPRHRRQAEPAGGGDHSRRRGQVLPAGEPGQIYVKNLMGSDFEYHNAPEKTAEVHLEPGVFTFGDIGYLDDDGYLFLSDRKIDMIISGGVNIYPAEIEAVLVTHPAVEDAAVFGIPNEEFGEEVKAAVTVRDGYTPGDALTRADRPLPRAPGRLQGTALHRLRGRAAAPRDRQALQAPAARPLLARQHADHLTRVTGHGLVRRYVLPKLIDTACSQKPMTELRARYVPRAAATCWRSASAAAEPGPLRRTRDAPSPGSTPPPSSPTKPAARRAPRPPGGGAGCFRRVHPGGRRALRQRGLHLDAVLHSPTSTPRCARCTGCSSPAASSTSSSTAARPTSRCSAGSGASSRCGRRSAAAAT
jgi:hypothetical protein